MVYSLLVTDIARSSSPRFESRCTQLVRVWAAVTAPPTTAVRPRALQLLLDLVLDLLGSQPPVEPSADLRKPMEPVGRVAAGSVGVDNRVEGTDGRAGTGVGGDDGGGDDGLSAQDVAAVPRHSPLLCAALLRMLEDFMRFGFCASAADVPLVLGPIGALLTTASHFDGGPPAPALSLASVSSSSGSGSGGGGSVQFSGAMLSGAASAVSAARSMLSPRRVTPRSYVQMIDEDEHATSSAGQPAGLRGETHVLPDDAGSDDELLAAASVTPTGGVGPGAFTAEPHAGESWVRAAWLAGDADLDEELAAPPSHAHAQPWLQVQLAAVGVLLVLRERHEEALLTRFLKGWRERIVSDLPSTPGNAAATESPSDALASGGSMPSAAPALFAELVRSEDASPFDAIAISGGPALASALRRLLLAPHKPLASTALRLLLALYGKGHALLSAASQLQLLHGDGAERLLERQRRAVATLSSLVEQYELWGALETAPDSLRMGKCTQLLRALADSCVPPARPTSNPKGSVPDSIDAATSARAADALLITNDDEWADDVEYDRASDAATAAFAPSRPGSAAEPDAQAMLRHLGVHEAVVGLLRLPRDESIPNTSLNTFQKERRSLLAATHAFAAAFVTDAPANARLLFAHMPLVLEHCVVKASRRPICTPGSHARCPRNVHSW